MNPAHAFDIMAATYDTVWTYSPVGCQQRDAFWRYSGVYLQNAARVLDIGCGTGEDALRLMKAGVEVMAIDASPAMVAIACARGVHGQALPIEQLDSLAGSFDAIMSNFGAFNCVRSVDSVRSPLARCLRPGGYLIICVLGGFCAWETFWFLVRGQPGKAFRRWRGRAVTSSGIEVFYPSPRHIRRSLSPDFRLVAQFGIGICVPPSYVRRLPRPVLTVAGVIDRSLNRLRLARVGADHRLFIFRCQE
jgi:SAM-dependent methyltransferase